LCVTLLRRHTFYYGVVGKELAMLKIGDSVQLSASDLVGHLNCRHLTDLDLAVASGMIEKPEIWDPLLEILRERGAKHEQGYIDHLRSAGYTVTVIDGVRVDKTAISETIDAMRAGPAVIVQGAFEAEGWSGRTDILKRVDIPSDLGEWSYEVVDTKLARETKGGTVLQLCLYADLVASVQGLIPEFCYVIVPWSDYKPQAFRINDYAAYYRHVKWSLSQVISSNNDGESYPDPKVHCDVCRWRQHCDAKRRHDDHLCLVAGITKIHINELKARGISTTKDLSTIPLPLPWKPDRGGVHSYTRIREQARIQIEGRKEVSSTGRITGAGLRFLSVEHEGNQTSSPEEADKVRDLVKDILNSDPSWIDRDGVEKAVTLEDILIIAPYNAQVFELQERLPGARIGTVDKFQGQEAPIVIYSMTTSSQADAPRGMEFLYSPNRLNVATSRAKCICILVGSSSVFETECRTHRHMQLANAFCRYLEMATTI